MNTEEKLIRAVREYPELYDSKHRHYYDVAYRDRLWEKIAENLQEESAVVKKKWTYLRDCYRKSLKKRRNGELIRFPYREWKYEKEMSFLHDHFWFGKNKPKDDQGQTDDEERPVSERSLQDTCEFSDFEMERDLTNEDDQDPFEETEAFFVKAEPIAVEKRVEKQNETNPTKKSKTTHTAASSSTSSGVRGYLCGNGQQEGHTSDHISAFFKYMEETVRGFPPLLQIEAKSKFSKLLSELELENLMSQQ